ncbi:MAG: hypothetical protein VYC34_09105, partial [Planctomycetota bacterium]|nr:hypothetical protein [Planctomycetota bacterium]
MRISMLRIAVLTALVAALIIPAGALSAEMKSSVLHDGRYDISFTVLDVGDEEFTIRRSANGFEITARLEPAPGDQPDCES